MQMRRAALRMATKSPRTSGLRFDAAMMSNVGAVRTLNEDVAVYAAPKAGDGRGRGSLALVADGMGGHAAGEVASGLAAEIIRRIYFELDGTIPAVLASAFAAANSEIINWAAEHPECAGMGTTCTALALCDGQAWLGHIGDSRAYLLRGTTFTQLSTDQTLVAELVREGKLTPAQAATSPVSNVILQALGMGPEIAPVIWNEPLSLQPGDIVVLCTDGLSGLVADETIADLAGRLPPYDACLALIDTAIAAGGHDNVSVGVLRAVTEGERSEDAGDTTRQMRLPDLAGVAPPEDWDGGTRELSLPAAGGRRDG